MSDMVDAPPPKPLVSAVLTVLLKRRPDPGFVEGAARSMRAFEASIEHVLKSDAFEHRYKKLRTSSTFGDAAQDNNPSYVGLRDYEPKATFMDTFEAEFAHRLAKRRDTFRVLFERMSQIAEPGMLIVETGCLRVPGNWAGDGQSTFLFDEFARYVSGTCISVDINPDSVDSARRACSARTTVCLNDSVSLLHQLDRIGLNRHISLLYLDSFDLDRTNPWPSAQHHMKELTAAWPLLRSGSVVCVDDYNVHPGEPSKGTLVNDFLTNIGAQVLFDDYQKAWLLP